jgi:hypothetical protein
MLQVLNVCILLFEAAVALSPIVVAIYLPPARRWLFWTLVGSLPLWGAICVTGFFREGAADPRLHRHLAHPLVVAVFGLTVFGIAALFNCNGGRTRRRTALLGVVTTGCVMLAAYTGYLGPSGSDIPMAPHTRQRFMTLHEVVLPLAGGVLLGLWCWSAARGPASNH